MTDHRTRNLKVDLLGDPALPAPDRPPGNSSFYYIPSAQKLIFVGEILAVKLNRNAIVVDREHKKKKKKEDKRWQSVQEPKLLLHFFLVSNSKTQILPSLSLLDLTTTKKMAKGLRSHTKKKYRGKMDNVIV